MAIQNKMFGEGGGHISAMNQVQFVQVPQTATVLGLAKKRVGKIRARELQLHVDNQDVRCAEFPSKPSPSLSLGVLPITGNGQCDSPSFKQGGQNG